MEPPSKRPRLSLYDPSIASGDELETARRQNDMVLKSRWEAIFEKYSRDFSDIGDEVDILTGRVIVNRGHLESMETETDPGQFDSKTFLRVMSTAQENGDSYVYTGMDGVLPSIENMAEDAVQGMSEEGRDSSILSTDSQSSSGMQAGEANREDTTLEPYDSDHDSLFANDDQERESSVDSLFDQVDHSFRRMESQTSEPLRANSNAMGETDIPDNDRIIEKFGPALGKEVIDLLEQRQQAHIEPAWRIPIAVEPTMTFPQLSRTTEVPARSPSPSGDGMRSIWAVRTEPTPRSLSPPVPRIRYESEDPLQEDFTEDRQTQFDEVYSSDGYVDDTKGPEIEEEAAGENHDPAIVTQLVETSVSGDCTFCHRYFRDKSGVMAHWDRLLKKVDKLGPDDPHDCAAIRKVRSKATRRVRLRRLTVGDFKSMVEFHEGAGLSFDEMSRSKLLRTRKTGPQLQDIYDQHRTPPSLRETPEPLRTWPAEEDQIVLELSKNPLHTIATLRRGMKGRTELQIGNRLADLWLAELRSETAATTPSNQPRAGLKEDVPYIKEESEDDLFR